MGKASKKRGCLIASVCIPLIVFGLFGGLTAQTQPPTCSCGDPVLFGSCTIGSESDPGQDPGYAAVVEVNGETRLYVSDLSNGFVNTYTLDENGVPSVTAGEVEGIPSPFGSLPSPTGVVFNPDNLLLYWAIDGMLVSTIPDLFSFGYRTSIQVVAEVDLVDLAQLLDLPAPGRLGGITYHAARASFWGVDIDNDVYFEFGLDGKPVIENDRVVHFMNPKSKPGTPGAFGNSISYVAIGDDSYFDTPVGSVAEGGVSSVERIWARDSTAADATTFSIGDPAGIYFPTAPYANLTGFITGVTLWPNACTGSDLEVLLELGEEAGDPFSENPRGPRVHFVNANQPSSAGLADFRAEAIASDVTVSWDAGGPYLLLEIEQVNVATLESRTVDTIPSGAAGPDSLVDPLVPDGVYDYVAVLSTIAGEVYPERVARVTVGRGSIVGSVSFSTPEFPADQAPFAATYMDSRNLLIVADRQTSNAHLYDADLNLIGAVPGPFGEGFIDGETTGVASIPGTSDIFWIENKFSGENFLQHTTLVDADGGGFELEEIDDPKLVLTPLNLGRHPILGDLAYDSFGDQFFAVDRNNGVAYSFKDDGTLTGSSEQRQIRDPEVVGVTSGLISGGFAIVDSTESALVLDWIVGDFGAGVPSGLSRATYSRSVPADVGREVFGSPQLLFKIALLDSLNSRELGSVALAEVDGAPVEFVVAADSGLIFRLSMDVSIEGERFQRGDANSDTGFNIADPSFILEFVFKGGDAPICDDAADANDDESINIADAIYLFRYLFLNGSAPPAPFPDCGRDIEKGLSCDQRSAACTL